MTPETILPTVAKTLQAKYRAERRAWVSDPENGLHPLPRDAEGEA